MYKYEPRPYRTTLSEDSLAMLWGRYEQLFPAQFIKRKQFVVGPNQDEDEYKVLSHPLAYFCHHIRTDPYMSEFTSGMIYSDMEEYWFRYIYEFLST